METLLHPPNDTRQIDFRITPDRKRVHTCCRVIVSPSRSHRHPDRAAARICGWTRIAYLRRKSHTIRFVNKIPRRRHNQPWGRELVSHFRIIINVSSLKNGYRCFRGTLLPEISCAIWSAGYRIQTDRTGLFFFPTLTAVVDCRMQHLEHGT